MRRGETSGSRSREASRGAGRSGVQTIRGSSSRTAGPMFSNAATSVFTTDVAPRHHQHSDLVQFPASLRNFELPEVEVAARNNDPLALRRPLTFSFGATLFGLLVSLRHSGGLRGVLNAFDVFGRVLLFDD